VEFFCVIQEKKTGKNSMMKTNFFSIIYIALTTSLRWVVGRTHGGARRIHTRAVVFLRTKPNKKKQKKKKACREYRNTDAEWKKTEKNIDDSRCMLQYGDNGESLFPERIPDLLNADPFCTNAVAFHVPVELRRSFRNISVIDPSVRPKNLAAVHNFFSKCCAIYTKPLSNGCVKDKRIQRTREAMVYGDDVPRLNQKKATGDFCILWTKKHALPLPSEMRKISEGVEEEEIDRNDNLYHYINGQNIRTRVVMYEWFVGSTRLSKEEEAVFSNRRGRKRKRGRAIKMTCNRPDICINPFHMYAHMSEHMEIEMNKETRGVPSEFGDRVMEHLDVRENRKRKKISGSLCGKEEQAFLRLGKAYQMSLRILDEGIKTDGNIT